MDGQGVRGGAGDREKDKQSCSEPFGVQGVSYSRSFTA